MEMPNNRHRAARVMKMARAPRMAQPPELAPCAPLHSPCNPPRPTTRLASVCTCLPERPARVHRHRVTRQPFPALILELIDMLPTCLRANHPHDTPHADRMRVVVFRLAAQAHHARRVLSDAALAEDRGRVRPVEEGLFALWMGASTARRPGAAPLRSLPPTHRRGRWRRAAQSKSPRRGGAAHSRVRNKERVCMLWKRGSHTFATCGRPADAPGPAAHVAATKRSRSCRATKLALGLQAVQVAPAAAALFPACAYKARGSSGVAV